MLDINKNKEIPDGVLKSKVFKRRRLQFIIDNLDRLAVADARIDKQRKHYNYSSFSMANIYDTNIREIIKDVREYVGYSPKTVNVDIFYTVMTEYRRYIKNNTN